MMMLKALLLSIFGIAVLITALLSCGTFDDLVQWEHDHHPAQWDQDGQPNGIIWRADGQMWSVTSNLLGSWYSVAWTFKSPRWVLEDPEALQLLRKYRRLGAWGVATILVGIGVAILMALFA